MFSYDFQAVFFPQVFPPKTLHAPLLSAIRANKIGSVSISNLILLPVRVFGVFNRLSSDPLCLNSLWSETRDEYSKFCHGNATVRSDVVCSATYVRPYWGLHVKCLQFLASFELSLNYCNRFLTGVPSGIVPFGSTTVTKLLVAFRTFANAPKLSPASYQAWNR